jgi:hypothetical protein
MFFKHLLPLREIVLKINEYGSTIYRDRQANN